LRTALESARESYRIRQQSLLPADGKTYDVMLIDADVDSTQRLLALLQQCGVAREIQHCPAVSQAISVLQTRPFDVILVNDQSLGSERLGELDLLRGAHKTLAVIALSNRIEDGQRPLRTRRNAKSKANTLPDDIDTLRRILLGGIDRKQKEASVVSAPPNQLDGLTQLASADAFGDLLEACVTQCRRTKTNCAVLLINLAHFKGVNASFGQEAGDTVLCEVGRRIQASVREEDAVARLGADDYAVLLTQIESAEVSTRVAQRILGITGLPVLLRDDLEVRLRAHVGISMYPDCSASSDELLCHARDALNAAKTEKFGFVLFSRGQTRQP
jgi:diguanylate cyclase (GGDEF)-like protein